MSNISQIRKLVNESGLFDVDWYQNRYPDVVLSGVDPLEHFCKYGNLLKRSPGPGFDSRFYFNTYEDVSGGSMSPIEHLLSLEGHAPRLTTAELVQERMLRLERSMQEKWLAGPVSPERDVAISYCIPVMGRIDDIKSTLEINLINNQLYRGVIEFIIIDFDDEPVVYPWVEKNFPDSLKDGYLRVIHDPNTLDAWHFGKAKNAFRPHVGGKVYSSLDGDNFVTKEETEYLLGLMEEHPLGFIFHHFSGEWGDGTSGRVSLPVSVYRNIGYDSNFLPRQFDEIDLILSSLIEFPELPFIGLSPEKNIFTLSFFARSFYEREKLGNRRIYAKSPPCRRPPLNPRGADYTDKAPHWRDMNNFNASVSSLVRGKNPALRDSNTAQVNKHKYNLIESLPAEDALKTIFRSSDCNIDINPSASDIFLISCVKNEEHFLDKFVKHHRSLGVKYFLIVDDNSDMQVSSMDLGANVFAVRPKVGDFRNAKTLWIEALMKAVVPEGAWVCTLDADEFLELPEGYESLHDISLRLEENSQEFATCLLVDMMPSPQVSAEYMVNVNENFDKVFNFYCDMGSPIDKDYADCRSIKWAFGEFSKISWRFDVRYHAFGTFDSLRKLSLFRYRSNRHLNQGFHSFHYVDGTASPGHDIWKSPIILPIRHFKLTKLFSDESKKRMIESAEGYHSRTKGNIEKIFGEDSSTSLGRIRMLSKWLRPVENLKRIVFNTDFNFAMVNE